MVANVTAKKPSTLTNIGEVSDPAASKAPTKVMPDTALVPDISGVCKVGGTLTISSTPKNNESTNNASNKIKISNVLALYLLCCSISNEGKSNSFLICG